MKKIFLAFLLCFTALSGNAFADNDIFVKIKAIKIALQTDAAQYIVKQRFMDVLAENMIAEDNIAPMVTLDDVTVACLKSVSVEDKKSVCHNFLLAVADAHNADLDSFDPDGDLKTDLGIDKSSIDKSSCEKNTGFIWFNNICIPRNPCKSIQYSEYCEKHDDKQYAVPKGNATEIDVINMYAEYKNFGCKVSTNLIFKDEGYVYVPCIGNNYKFFMFSENENLGLLTDLLCDSVVQVHYSGWPTYCLNSKARCEKIKSFVNGRIKVEWVKYGDEDRCQIGEYSDEYYIGEIHNGSLDVNTMMKK